jgi:hypothetical protein
MPLLIGDVEPGDWEALDQALAAIQTWAGKQEGAGKWVDVAYDSTLYGQNDGVWTVEVRDQKRYRYSVVGDTLHVQVYLVGTATDANVDEELHVYLPPGFQVDVPGEVPSFVGSVTWFDNTGASSGTGIVMVNFADNVTANTRRLSLLRNIQGTAWPASSSDLAVTFFATVPVRRET